MPFIHTKWILIVATALATHSTISCAAKYGTKRKVGAEGAEDPTKVPNESNDQAKSKGAAGPTAGIEVLVDGVVVNQIPVGKTATIRPTAETKDGDDPIKDGCAHPGIVEANYTLAGQTKLSSSSTDGCGSLEVQHKFDRSGSVEIKLEVRSNENETANASGTISVVDPTSNATAAPSLRIEVVPLEVDVGVDVAFKAFCIGQSPPALVTWNFGDSKSSAESSTKHAYGVPGSYPVICKCNVDGQDLEASATVVVKQSAGTGGDNSTGQGTTPGGSSGKATSDAGTGGSGAATTGSGTGESGNSSSTGSDTATSGTGVSGSGQSTGTVPNDDDHSSTGSAQNPGQNPAQSPAQN